MAFNLSGLTDYVNVNKDVLIKRIVLGDTPNRTIDHLTKQLGVKTKERINYMDVDIVLQDGKNCGFNASGATNFVDRDLETAILKINDAWCDKDFLGKFAENQVAIAAGKERLPFEQEISAEIVAKVGDAIEKLAWQGVKASDLVDGFVTIAEGADSASTISVSLPSGTSAYAAIKAVYMQIPEEILDKAFIAVSPALFREYVQDLVSANLYHYDPANGAPEEMFLPGTNVKVRNTKGLAGTKKIYASCWENMFMGADATGDSEDFKLWYSEDDELFKLKIRFNMGFMTAYPDAVVLGTIA